MSRAGPEVQILAMYTQGVRPLRADLTRPRGCAELRSLAGRIDRHEPVVHGLNGRRQSLKPKCLADAIAALSIETKFAALGRPSSIILCEL